MTTIEKRHERPNRARQRKASQRARYERDAWYDGIAVERALRAWLLDRRVDDDTAGRALSLRERMIVREALIEVGESRTRATEHVRMGTATVCKIEKMIVERELHAARVAAAVAYLDRHEAREKIMTRDTFAISQPEALRILGATRRGRLGQFNSRRTVA